MWCKSRLWCKDIIRVARVPVIHLLPPLLTLRYSHTQIGMFRFSRRSKSFLSGSCT